MIDLKREIEDLERRSITQALQDCGGKKMKAAEYLGLRYRAFHYLYRKHFGIPQYVPKSNV